MAIVLSIFRAMDGSSRIFFLLVTMVLMGAAGQILINAGREEIVCSGSLASGEISRKNNNSIILHLGDRRLKVPWRFLLPFSPNADQICGFGGDGLVARFWFPGRHPVEQEFWYRDQHYVKGWSSSLNPAEQTVIKIQSLQPIENNVPPSFNSARRSINNTFYLKGRVWIDDILGLKKWSFRNGKIFSENWVREAPNEDVFISCGSAGNRPSCVGFADFKDFGLSVRFDFSHEFISRFDELVASIRAQLKTWIVD